MLTLLVYVLTFNSLQLRRRRRGITRKEKVKQIQTMMMRGSATSLALLILLSLSDFGSSTTDIRRGKVSVVRKEHDVIHSEASGLLELGKKRLDGPNWLSSIQGGITSSKGKTKIKSGKKEIRRPGQQTASQKVKEFYKGTPLITRMQLSLTLVLTLLSLVVIDPQLLLLDPVRIIRHLQLWRPFTAAAFMGSPSMSWLSNMYFLFQYGTALEQIDGTAQQLVFILFQVFVLSILASLIGLPVTSNALITAALHCLGRQDPLRDVNWLFSIKIKYWMLPFCLALVDMLQAQNPLAALPAALGILSGHLYYFLRHVWPKMGGREWLLAPQWWVKRLNRSNDHIIFRRDRSAAAQENASSGSIGGKKKVKGKVYKMKKISE